MSGESAPQSNEHFRANRNAEHAETARKPERKLSAEELKSPDDQEAREAVEKALNVEKESAEMETASTPTSFKSPVVSAQRKKTAYKKTMAQIQKEMPASSRAFSKFIHNQVVEDTSEVIGRTVARPTSILLGSFTAFTLLLVVYLFAKHNGFRLSGSEFIVLFITGWLAGLLADFLRHMFSGER